MVIDVQLVAFDGKITPPISDGAKLLNNIEVLISSCRERSVPVIYLQTSALSGHPYAKDTHGWEIHPQVAPVLGEQVFSKMGPDGFENPALHAHLQDLAAEGIIACGTWSDGCVLSTCSSAIENGYSVTLAADAHGTCREFDDEAVAVVEQVNSDMLAKQASVICIEEIEKALGD